MKFFRIKPGAPDPEEEDCIEGERALTPVNKGLTLQNRLTNLAVIGALVILTGVLLYKYYAGMYREYEIKKGPVKDLTHTVATTSLPPLSMPAPASASESSAQAPHTPDQPPPLQPASPPAIAGPASGNRPVGAKSEAETIRDRRLKRELRFHLESGGTGATFHKEADTTTSPSQDRPANTQSSRDSEKGARLARFSAARAFMLPDPTLIMTRGKVIPCTVQPAIDTTLSGIVTCVTGDDATGADNKVSLMDRGTVCVGKQGGGVTHGQRRVGIIWQRCETPQHVLVPLEGDAADALGRPGIAGQVDNHFWDRFGAAIALSLISDIGPYLIATRQGDGNNNTTIAFPNILNGPQAVIGEVLRNTMDIQPTIHAPQGARVLIYLAGDIDFRDVYQLERSN